MGGVDLDYDSLKNSFWFCMMVLQISRMPAQSLAMRTTLHLLNLMKLARQVGRPHSSHCASRTLSISCFLLTLEGIAFRGFTVSMW